MNENTNAPEFPAFPGTKNYIRTDENNNIIKGFTEHEVRPQEGDILLREEPVYSRFCLFPGDDNARPLNRDGFPHRTGSVWLYRYDADTNGVVAKTEEEIAAEAELLPSTLAADTRAERNRRLSEADPMMYEWRPMTSEKRQEWTDYMQALREVPEQEGFPENIEWPEKPE
jgi:hypothetical protein